MHKYVTTAGVLRLLLGFVLLMTGLGKLLDVPGFVVVLESYQTLPQFLLLPVAVLLVLIELRLAECLLLGSQLYGAVLCGGVLHLVFFFWALYHVLLERLVPNCGCFGVFFARPLSWTTVVEDLVMLGLFGALFLCLRRGNADGSGDLAV